ncbi:MAG: HD domain-containing protein [Nitrospirota bacterium]|nr:HD domain-containing protein [Nitrospirota bacterium]
MSHRSSHNNAQSPSRGEKEDLLLRLALTERKLSLTTQKLEARNQELSAIYRLSETIGSEHHINRLCEKTVEEIQHTLGAGTVSILLRDHHTGDLVTAATTGRSGESLTRPRIKPGDGLLWQVVKTGKPLLLPSVRTVKASGARTSPAGIAAPIKTKDKTLGVIYALGKQNDQEFTARERDLLSGIANQAAVALDNATLYHDLENVFVGIAWSFASALDAKSPWTAGHSKRVTQYSVSIAEELNYPAEFLHSIRTCGLLHDIGKIGISEKILDKPGAITRAEHKTIAEHAIQGAKILEHIDTFQPLLPGIRHHHERWDGRGFPDGLRNEDIPVLARVLAVADSYDAITSDRPYRKKRSRADAIAEIKRCSGTQFDPLVVEAFVAVSAHEAF